MIRKKETDQHAEWMIILGVGGWLGMICFPLFLCVGCPLLFLYWLYVLDRRKTIQHKTLHTAKCKLSAEGEIWRIHYLLRLYSLGAKQIPPGGEETGGFWGDGCSGRWCRICLFSLLSPLPFVGTESVFRTRSVVFIQIIQYTVNLQSTCCVPGTIFLVVVHLSFYWGILV